MFSRVNVKDQLSKQRSKIQATESDILKAVQDIFDQVDDRETRINHSLFEGHNHLGNDWNIDLLEADRIYHIDQIKEICLRYRLRFLDTKYFKNPIPREALTEIKRLENLHETTLNGFKIIAPSKMFKLEDADDPLLFAPIGNGYFHLIHKWGNDLSPYRRIMAWPFRSLENIILTTVLLSLLATYLVQAGLFSNTSDGVTFLVIFFFMLKSIGAIVLYYFFAAGKNFNSAIWNSKFFNA
jgi:hypothetical protein